MVGIDTNILVRYFAQDDPEQSERALSFITSLSSANPGFISLVTLVELVWVLQSRYRADKLEILKILGMLMRTKEFLLENAETAGKALHRFATSGADFADCMIERSGHTGGCTFTFTFDEEAARSAGMRMVP